MITVYSRTINGKKGEWQVDSIYTDGMPGGKKRTKKSGKRKYRLIDFKRSIIDIPATVERIEYDPNRSAHIALIKYKDGDYSYIICPQKLKKGDQVVSSQKTELKVGNCLELKDIPPGSSIHNIELVPNTVGKMARSAGSSATLSGFDDATHNII